MPRFASHLSNVNLATLICLGNLGNNSPWRVPNGNIPRQFHNRITFKSGVYFYRFFSELFQRVSWSWLAWMELAPFLSSSHGERSTLFSRNRKEIGSSPLQFACQNTNHSNIIKRGRDVIQQFPGSESFMLDVSCVVSIKINCHALRLPLGIPVLHV